MTKCSMSCWFVLYVHKSGSVVQVKVLGIMCWFVL